MQNFLNSQFLFGALVAVATFATILSVAMPLFLSVEQAAKSA